MDDRYGSCRHYVRCICMPVTCDKCADELQQLSQGLTDYQWYKDYYCPTCKRSVVKLDKDRRSTGDKITERNY